MCVGTVHARSRSHEMVVRGMEGLEINASDLNATNSTINLSRLDINIKEGADAESGSGQAECESSPRESPTKRLSSSYGLLLTPNAKGGASGGGQGSTMALFHDPNGADMLENEDDVVKRLPGGNFAVFRGERKSPQPRET